MSSQPARAAGPVGPAAPQPAAVEGLAEHDRGTLEGGSSLVRAARVFATRCHARQSRDSDGARFIEHPLEVARLLRAAGCSDVVVAAGLLHDVLEHTAVTDDELRACFGADVAALVRAVSDRPVGGSYRERKRRLREQVRQTGGDAAVLFAADKISKVRALNAALQRGRRHVTNAGGGHAAARREHVRQLQIEHYQESLEMLRGVAGRHPLVDRFADELADCLLTHAGASAPAKVGTSDVDGQASALRERQSSVSGRC